MPRVAKELKYCPSCEQDRTFFKGEMCGSCYKEKRREYPDRCYQPIYDGQYWPPKKIKTK